MNEDDYIDEAYDRMKDERAEAEYEELDKLEKEELIAGYNKFNLNGGEL